ncbi:cell division protein MraZ [Lacticaseibacillus pantheris DSM 15945 = JCM 12539 = NBRC 106106]|jgi:MraZ protein|uniref:Transcriptional regulator MraZ n=1 Tax=Lacticaseibacillus pantheris DSM 15945 = JCM 12539 = NBRC 106106 TaxID=1423783 RepID=A0A0R1TT07_9LACO|nr:division/cell wall cluster transcriptional repressor MraZ [Lacticaseibacillus pantheris]KRL84454.1 cell division protein MraZ [Lacticaseibacillus pantheris DSM 15945 = JCM 12539 = NBRC 106106]
MFMGEFHHNLDAKGRLIIPAKFREQLGDDFVLTRGMDGCLFGYPQSEWAKLQEKLQTLPLTQKNARTFVRLLYSAATECELDKQGRINVPKPLMTHAALDKACVLVGVANRIEIWSTERWEQFATDAESDFDEISENLMDFGL